ncbi:Co-chaperone Hsc20 [Ascobolus immersus RN42]|uniref:Co-chaperone Hsc20 n=1 Tax=Ascobolus immersus RN42 TaxID=1160509 RepID=A0A3N4IG97_ASCIM|nr:Co-chaperone Hsc20 [Ascobolus immersus RN42]
MRTLLHSLRQVASRRQQPLLRKGPPPSSPSSTTLRHYSDTSSQPPKNRTIYSLFPQTLPSGPPPSGPFSIDTRALRQEFLKLQQTSHPDLQHSNPTSSTASSSLLNSAYSTLCSPLLRAEYLLHGRGIDVKAEDASGEEEVGQEVLLEVFEMQERIEEAEGEEEIEVLREQNEAEIVELVERLEVAFEGDDLEAARRLTVMLRFREGVRQALKDWEPGKEVRLVH